MNRKIEKNLAMGKQWVVLTEKTASPSSKVGKARSSK
jgi:hypothetical protein